MNIIVRPYGSSLCSCRPDTTWERENKDLYTPGRIDSWKWSPIAFMRISKAGKCIGRKFVSRYYDAFGFGALLYIGSIDGSEADTAASSCADHTSILPYPLYNPEVMENPDNEFVASKDGTEIFRTDCKEIRQILEDAACKASELTSLRIGDIVAVELAPLKMLADRTEETAQFSASFCENEVYDFKIIF